MNKQNLIDNKPENWFGALIQRQNGIHSNRNAKITSVCCWQRMLATNADFVYARCIRILVPGAIESEQKNDVVYTV